jgi:hypothetical protein
MSRKPFIIARFRRFAPAQHYRQVQRNFHSFPLIRAPLIPSLFPYAPLEKDIAKIHRLDVA